MSRSLILRVVVGLVIGAAMIPTYMILARLAYWADLRDGLQIALNTMLMACIPGYVLANVIDNRLIGVQQIIDAMYIPLNAVVYGLSWVGLTSRSTWKRVIVGLSWGTYLGWMCVELVR